jgi:NhaP-type Na+/H+ or K+/H+ antiporter
MLLDIIGGIALGCALGVFIGVLFGLVERRWIMYKLLAYTIALGLYYTGRSIYCITYVYNGQEYEICF